MISPRSSRIGSGFEIETGANTMSLSDLSRACVTKSSEDHPMAGLDPYYSSQSVIKEKLTVTPIAVIGHLGHRPLVSGSAQVYVRLADGSICIPSLPPHPAEGSKIALAISEGEGLVVAVPYKGVSLEGAEAWINYDYGIDGPPVAMNTRLGI